MKFILIILFLSTSAWANSTRLLNINFQCEKNLNLKIKTLVSKIKQKNIDIVFLQEFCDSQDLNSESNLKNEIKNNLANNWNLYKIYTHLAWDKYDEYLVILTNKKPDLIEKNLLPYSPLARGYISVKINGNWFTNIHLTHTSSQEGFRKQQVKFLSNEFSYRPSVIIGDFNAKPNSTDFTSFTQAGMKSLFPFATYPSSRPYIKYDGLWYSSKVIFNEVNVQKVFHTRINKNNKTFTYFSDHIGLIFEFLN